MRISIVLFLSFSVACAKVESLPEAPVQEPAWQNPVVDSGPSPQPEPRVDETIVGEWLFIKMHYKNQDLPPRDPRLELKFRFESTGQSRLYWTFDQGRSFCERLAEYSFDGSLLKEKITWVNPKNANSCGSDPDMQLGRETQTQAFMKDSFLWINIGLGAEDFFYIWKRI
jgi:hypothetical protein